MLVLVHNSHVAQMEVLFCDYEIFPHAPNCQGFASLGFRLFPIKMPFWSPHEALLSGEKELISEVKS